MLMREGSVRRARWRGQRAMILHPSSVLPHVEIDVATTLTRARKARLPSPWTKAVDFLDLGARARKKVEHWRAWLCRKQRKSTASGQGEGSEMGRETESKKFTDSRNDTTIALRAVPERL